MSRAARRDDRNLLTNQFGRECWKLIGFAQPNEAFHGDLGIVFSREWKPQDYFPAPLSPERGGRRQLRVGIA
jgi:hypothetical protein